MHQHATDCLNVVPFGPDTTLSCAAKNRSINAEVGLDSSQSEREFAGKAAAFIVKRCPLSHRVSAARTSCDGNIEGYRKNI